ncbi:MAG: hypothetical protein ACPL06_04495 [Candidatus Anstonellales archaeon]
MVVRSKEKETKEEKTQADLLKKVFGEKKGSLYYQLNLDQFVVIDKEKGKVEGNVEIQKLQRYLEFLGFSSGAIALVFEYLRGKGNLETVEQTIELEYKNNINIQNKSEIFNELVRSVENDLGNIIQNENIRKSVAFSISLGISIGRKTDLDHLMADILITIDKLPLKTPEKNSIVSSVATDLTFSSKTKEILSQLQNFEEQELTGDEKIIVENSVKIGKMWGKTLTELTGSYLSPEQKRELLDEYRKFLISLRISKDKANKMTAELAGRAYNELMKQGRDKEAKELYSAAKNLLVGTYGMSLDEFNKSFLSGIMDINLENSPKELIETFKYGAGLITFEEFIETYIRPLFGGTEEMQAGEAVVKQIEDLKKMIEEKYGEEKGREMDEIIKRVLDGMEENIDKFTEEERERIERLIELLRKGAE